MGHYTSSKRTLPNTLTHISTETIPSFAYIEARSYLHEPTKRPLTVIQHIHYVQGWLDVFGGLK